MTLRTSRLNNGAKRYAPVKQEILLKKRHVIVVAKSADIFDVWTGCAVRDLSEAQVLLLGNRLRFAKAGAANQ